MCSVLFVFPQPAQEALDESFQSDYFATTPDPEESRLVLEFEKWRRPALKLIAAQIQRAKERGQMLDVGCASGALFDYFPDKLWSLYGIEPSALAFKRAEQRLAARKSIHLFNTYLLESELPPASFDVITILGSLFYMADPKKELAQARSLLKADGVLAIEIPGYVYHRLWRTGIVSNLLRKSRCSLPDHLFFFSRKSLSFLLRESGFTISYGVPLPSSVYGSLPKRLA